MFYYNGNGEQVSSLSGEVEKSESSSPTNNTPQDPSISGGPTGQNNTPNAPNANTNENDKSAKTQNLNNKNNNTIVLLEIKNKTENKNYCRNKMRELRQSRKSSLSGNTGKL